MTLNWDGPFYGKVNPTKSQVHPHMFLHRTKLTSLRSELVNNLLDMQVGRHHLSPHFTDEKIESQGAK